MTLVWAGVVVISVASVAVGIMLLVRRSAPAGSRFADGDRAAGVFGVLATGFAVLLGFVVFLSFESFDTSRSGAETEAELITQQFELAQFLPAAVRPRLSGELICYARAVVHQEWPAMENGDGWQSTSPWGIALFRTLADAEPRTASEQAAFGKFLDERSDRQLARNDRLHGGEGVIPLPLWIVLFVSSGVIFVFMLFFADSAERVVVQGAMMGSVAVVIASTFVLLWFLDNPYHSGPGALRPIAMERTLDILAEGSKLVGGVAPPCDELGAPNG